LTQQPSVQVGAVPPGVTTEVWVAPQTSAKRKARQKGKDSTEVAPPELDIIPDARKGNLTQLFHEYGDKLRVALHPDDIYAAITGSHIRV
jgi:oxalate---CoA ligase